MKAKKRQKLGRGYIWFCDHAPDGYMSVCLLSGPHGNHERMILKIGKLGGWKKVTLYAEYVE
jgi:hypothetical protein